MTESQVVRVNQLKADRKSLKKSTSRAARTVLFYNLIALVTVTIIAFVYPRLASGISEREIFENGWAQTLSVLVAMIVIVIYRKKELIKDLKITKLKMTRPVFVVALSCFMGVQLLVSVGMTIMQHLLNNYGYTLESPPGGEQVISMIIYNCIIAPVVEEIVFRGAILRSLTKYGKHFAIVISSVLFGFFHGNLFQNIFGTLAGIVLAYVALEYSIKWSILLHFINNCIFVQILGSFFGNINPTIADICFYVIYSTFFIVAVIAMIKKRKLIKNYISKNKPQKRAYLYAFTSVWMIIFLACCTFLAFDGIITKI